MHKVWAVIANSGGFEIVGTLQVREAREAVILEGWEVSAVVAELVEAVLGGPSQVAVVESIWDRVIVLMNSWVEVAEWVATDVLLEGAWTGKLWDEIIVMLFEDVLKFFMFIVFGIRFFFLLSPWSDIIFEIELLVVLPGRSETSLVEAEVVWVVSPVGSSWELVSASALSERWVGPWFWLFFNNWLWLSDWFFISIVIIRLREVATKGVAAPFKWIVVLLSSEPSVVKLPVPRDGLVNLVLVFECDSTDAADRENSSN